MTAFTPDSLVLNRKLPLWYQVSQSLRASRLGRRPADPLRLPTEERLAGHYGVSVLTMRQALKELEAEGLISRHRRHGTFIEPAALRADLLHVRHVIVVGHHGCSGVRMALRRSASGLAEHWLRHLQDVQGKHAALVDAVAKEEERVNLLAELNVLEQASNVCESSSVREAWRQHADLAVSGWIYSLRDGLLIDLGFNVDGRTDLAAARAGSLAVIRSRYGR